MRVQKGTIRAIKAAGYGSGASAIARVIIGFERNVETDIANLRENSLLVKILGEGSNAVAEVEKPAASPRGATEKSPPKPEVARANKQAELEKLQREQEEAKRAAELKAQEEARQKRLAEIEEKKRLENEARIAEAKAKEKRLRQAAGQKQKKQEEARPAAERHREQPN